jgi:hypothetical protein
MPNRTCRADRGESRGTGHKTSAEFCLAREPHVLTGRGCTANRTTNDTASTEFGHHVEGSSTGLGLLQLHVPRCRWAPAARSCSPRCPTAGSKPGSSSATSAAGSDWCRRVGPSRAAAERALKLSAPAGRRPEVSARPSPTCQTSSAGCWAPAAGRRSAGSTVRDQRRRRAGPRSRSRDMGGDMPPWSASRAPG